VRRFGGDIRPGYEVERILVDTYTCTGVMLVGGEEISAGAVLSSVDPKRTFLSLVQPVNLPPEFVWRTQSIKMRGAASKLHLLTDGTHGVPEGTSVLAPSLEYLERAYAAKYGNSERLYLEVTTHGNVVSTHIQFALRTEGRRWEIRVPISRGWS
jgi:phytoene dehydrogenase-like protein